MLNNSKYLEIDNFSKKTVKTLIILFTFFFNIKISLDLKTMFKK
jgi:hypothetical protein